MKHILKKFWNFLTLLRNGLANFIFIIIILFIVVSIFSGGREPLPNQAPMLLTLTGVLVDQSTHQPTILDLMDESQDPPETLVRDVVFAIKTAATDERISGLVLNLNRLRGGSLSKLEEIGQAIDVFKASGKPVVAFADSFTQSQYFLATYADKIYLNKMGNIALTGFAFYNSYFKEAADKLSVKFHLFKVGNYKDAAEPYVRNSMSEASREHNSSWINELWGRYTSKIETSRDLPSGAIESFIEELNTTLAASEEDFGTIAKNAGLVDELVSRIELNKLLIEQFGKDEGSEFFKAVLYPRYLSEVKPRLPAVDGNIGLIVATGTIIDGSANEGQIGGNTLSGLIRQATEDDQLEALIIRVDSGGGSAFASEVIRNQILEAREQGLPVYFSMGSVAASGGYWIATAADEIWALPTTITGSIGVWGLIPNVSESMKRLGVHSDGIGTTPLSDIYQIDRPLSPQAAQVFQSSVNNIYRKFINLVADARQQPPEDIHAIAQGRVWTGEKALEFGLVDAMGTLDDVIAAVGEKHQLEAPKVKLIQRPLSTQEQILRALTEEAKGLGEVVGTNALGEDVGVILDQLPIEALAQPLKHHSSNVYAECLECLAP